jgi:mediator of RNA polymerase II transcription subunit 17
VCSIKFLFNYSTNTPFSKQSSTSALGENLRRIFIERGFDFFDKHKGVPLQDALASDQRVRAEDASEPVKSKANPATKIMTTEELFDMRMEILPQLL